MMLVVTAGFVTCRIRACCLLTAGDAGCSWSSHQEARCVWEICGNTGREIRCPRATHHGRETDTALSLSPLHTGGFAKFKHSASQLVFN